MESTVEQLKNVIIENGKFIVKEFETSDKDIVNYFQQIDPEVLREKFVRDNAEKQITKMELHLQRLKQLVPDRITDVKKNL